MERHFDEELNSLREKILGMSGKVEEALRQSLKALIERDKVLADDVIANDNEIDLLEVEIDDYCIKLLALRQPEARDLRFITSVMKINNELERIADLAVNISERTIDLLEITFRSSIEDVSNMAEIVREMLTESIDAFANNDSKAARDILKRDDIIDTMNINIFKKYLSHITTHPMNGEGDIDIISIGKYLERIADHTTNICEEIIYFVEGKVIKHNYNNNATLLPN